MPDRQDQNRRRRTEHGLTLVEALVAITVMGLSAMGFAGVSTSARTLRVDTRDLAYATHAARQLLDQIEAVPFREAFARYNATIADDPAGVPSPGSSVLLEVSPAEPGMVPRLFQATVIFPVVDVAGVPQLRENLARPEWGLPADLDGDGSSNAADCAATYLYLPLSIQVQWTGENGPRTARFDHALSEI